MSYLGGRTIYIDSDGYEHFDYERDYEPKPTTNYDRIISKTPEELAEWIDHIQADAYERGLMETPVVDYPNIYSGWLDWLKQDVDER